MTSKPLNLIFNSIPKGVLAISNLVISIVAMVMIFIICNFRVYKSIESKVRIISYRQSTGAQEFIIDTNTEILSEWTIDKIVLGNQEMHPAPLQIISSNNKPITNYKISIPKNGQTPALDVDSLYNVKIIYSSLLISKILNMKKNDISRLQ